LYPREKKKFIEKFPPGLKNSSIFAFPSRVKEA